MHCRNYSWSDAKSCQTLAISLWQTYMTRLQIYPTNVTNRVTCLVTLEHTRPLKKHPLTYTLNDPENNSFQFHEIDRNWVPSILFGGMGIALVKTHQFDCKSEQSAHRHNHKECYKVLLMLVCCGVFSGKFSEHPNLKMSAAPLTILLAT